MENLLTSLLKKKYGTTTSSPVVFTEKDTLYTAFRKLADNIYKNGSWTQEDEQRAVSTIIRNRNGYPVGKEDPTFSDWKNRKWIVDVKVKPIDEAEKQLLKTRMEGKIAYSATSIKKEVDGSNEKTRNTYVILDPNNKTGTKHGEFYYFSDKEPNEVTYYALGNMNRAIGYDKLQRDILKEFDETGKDQSFERRDLERLLEYLSIASYTGKKNADLFVKDMYGELTDEFLATLRRDESERFLGDPSRMEEHLRNNEVSGEERQQLEEQLAANWVDLSNNPTSPVKVNLDRAPYIIKDGRVTAYVNPYHIKKARKKNAVLDFVETYIQNTYDILLQREYEKDIDKQTRASAWQTKKNINKETLKIMEETSLNQYFKFVEIDNDVDLKLFDQFEKEMERMHAILPKTGDTVPELRLRKLGNHKALGLYVPSKHTIAIDFRDTSDEIGGVGIQSFIHEYGHALDYGRRNGELLSMRPDFKPIVARYRENLALRGKGSYVADKANYYTAPTEVFARAFELYVSEAGLNSIFLKTKEVYESTIEYTLFDQQMREALTTYFDNAFPNLKAAILESTKTSMDLGPGIVVDQKTLDVPKNPQIETIKSLKFRHKNIEVSLGEAMENCELSLMDKAAALQKQEENVRLYKRAVPRTETIVALADLHVEILDRIKAQSKDTLFLFDGTELAEFTTNTNHLVVAMTDREVFTEVYGDILIQGIKNEVGSINHELPVSEPEVQPNVVQENLPPIKDLKTAEDITNNTSSLEADFSDNSRLGQAKRKLARLKKEYDEKFDQLHEHQMLTNGQPMNDKRNGGSWFSRKEQIENNIRNISAEISRQEERVAKLEEQKEDKEMGLNKYGGLIMSVENIPHIQEEIEKSKIGKSLFSKDTIRKYEKQLETLLEMKERAESAHQRISEQAQSLIDSGAITAWAKNPTIYFVKGLKKVALELQGNGTFLLSEKYRPETAEENEVVESLLSNITPVDLKVQKVPVVDSDPIKESEIFDEQLKAVQRFWKEVLAKKTSFEIHGSSLEKEREERPSLVKLFSPSTTYKGAFQLTEFDREGQPFSHDELTEEEIDAVFNGDTSHLLQLFPYGSETSEYVVKFVEEEKVMDSIEKNETERKEQMPQTNQEETISSPTSDEKTADQLMIPDYSFIHEINYSFEETKLEMDHFMRNISMNAPEQQFVSKADLESLLDSHLKQVEAVVRQSIETMETIPNPTQEQLQAETDKVKKSIRTILSDLKDKMKQSLITKKKNALDTMDTLRISFKNKINRRLLEINSLLKQLTVVIDQKVIIEEKQADVQKDKQSSDIETSDHIEEQNKSSNEKQKETVSVTSEKQTSDSQAEAIHEEQKPSIVETAASINTNTEERLNPKNEKQEVSVSAPSGEKESDVQGESVQKDQPVLAVKETSRMEDQQLKRIEELSNQLGFKVSEKEKATIKGMPQTQKAALLQSMEEALEEKNKAVATEAMGLEVG